MSRTFSKSANDTAPAVDGVAVTPDDAVDLPDGVTRALWIGGAGTGALRVTMASGRVVNLAGVGAGLLPVAVSRVHAAGTGVTNIVALY